ncbi:GTPase-activating protein [Terramyces sp. JEL0728]|nr:GTPase-activating protein [Terramyces sp. JEL0728]
MDDEDFKTPEDSDTVNSPKERVLFRRNKGKPTTMSVESFTQEPVKFNSTINTEKEKESTSIFKSIMTLKPPSDITNFVVRQFGGNTDKEKEKLVETKAEENHLTPEEEDEEFIISRLKQHAKSTGELSIKKAGTWFTELSNGFQSAKNSFMGKTDDPDKDPMDWEFWGKVINDYENIIASNPRQFRQHLRKGLPEPIRGMMWQLMSNSKSEGLEEEYMGLLERQTRLEKIIRRDLARTFPGHEFFKDPEGPGQTSLFNVLKGSFGMPEEQSFCVLVKLMNEFDFRDLYGPKMIGLQVRNHQFDKLIEEQFPAVFKHLEKQDVKSTMYASQWFMTVFAYRFPLEIVFRIFDIIFAEGPEAVLRFALALIKHNQETIVTLEFEKLLDYLKEELFEQYIDDVNRLIQDASQIKISKRKLDLWETEFIEMLRQSSPDVIELEKMKNENRKMLKSYKLLEQSYELLNREHIDLLNNFIEEKDKCERQFDRNEELQEQVDGFKKILSGDRNHAEIQVRSEMEELAQKNIELIRKNADLQDTVHDLEQQLLDARMAVANVENEKEELRLEVVKLKSQMK